MFSLQAVDIVRPICQLLNVEYDGLENFEALVCLGNLASLNDSTRNRILKESDFVTQIESYMFEDHKMIRCAAVQCFTNLCLSPLHVKRCEGKNDKVKYCVLLCGDDDDVEVVRAAAGALAILTSQSEKCCRKIFDSLQWNECILNLLANPDLDIVLRGVVIVKNMITAGKDVAEKVIETPIMECLQAHIFKAQREYIHPTVYYRWEELGASLKCVRITVLKLRSILPSGRSQSSSCKKTRIFSRS